MNASRYFSSDCTSCSSLLLLLLHRQLLPAPLPAPPAPPLRVPPCSRGAPSVSAELLGAAAGLQAPIFGHPESDAALRWKIKMGQKHCSFTEDQLEALQDCSFFTRKEILRLHSRFRELAPHLVPLDFTNDPDVKIPKTLIVTMPELKENPFRERIVETFSEDKSGNLSFNDFVDLFSALSETSPRELKIIYAFHIYDFNSDQLICASDLHQTVSRLTRGDLSPQEVQLVCQKVLEEADLDGDSKLSFSDFHNMMSKAPDFLSNFHIRI